MIPLPMRWAKTDSGWIDEALPERSEAALSFRTKTMPVGYVPRISWDLLHQLAESDAQRQGKVTERLQKMRETEERDRKRVSKDRWREARGYLNWHARTHPMAV